jgi:hypothetical protein
LTMLESSTAMNVPVRTVPAMTHLCGVWPLVATPSSAAFSVPVGSLAAGGRGHFRRFRATRPANRPGASAYRQLTLTKMPFIVGALSCIAYPAPGRYRFEAHEPRMP